MEPMEPTKQAQWRRRSEIPLMVAAVVYLAAYSKAARPRPRPIAAMPTRPPSRTFITSLKALPRSPGLARSEEATTALVTMKYL